MVIEEAQRIPELFGAIQVASDGRGGPGQYVLSGSQNYLLLRNVTQSLAGRVGMVRLMPLSYREAVTADPALTPDAFMLRGGYPRLYDVGIPARVYYANYLVTYVERDVSGYIDSRSLSSFRRFLGLCAQACGSLVNVSRLAKDVGISWQTAESWLSLLEASHTVLRLPPYHASLRKRLTKTPKLYFWDTGLLCHLLGIETADQLRDSPMRGAVFEDLVVAETAKRHLNSGREPRLSFYRDDSKIEVDLVDLTVPDSYELVEIRSSVTFRQSYLRHLAPVGEELGIPPEGRSVVTRGETFDVRGTTVWSSRDWLTRE